MASRLSEENLVSLYHKGYFGFSHHATTAKKFRLTPQVNLDAIIARPDAQAVIQALPPQTLYHALKEHGLEESLEVLPLLSPDQFTRICDYDGWHADRLIPQRIFKWLQLYHQISPEAMCERFRQLDEELQVAALAPVVRSFTQEEYDKMSPEQQDSLYRFPGDALYYSILSESKEVRDGIETLMESAMATDMNYALALIAHSSTDVPQESEQLLAQFRRARLEEDGFVSYEESLLSFLPEDLQTLKTKWLTGGATQTAVSSYSSGPLFLDRAVARIASESDADAAVALQRGLLFLSNALCTATEVEADDTEGLKCILSHARGLVSLALEYLADGDLEQGIEILKAEQPRTLFRTGIALVNQIRAYVLELLVAKGIANARRLQDYLKVDKLGLIIRTIERDFMEQIGFERVEILKGIFNRFPVIPLAIQEAQRVTFVPITRVTELNALTRTLVRWRSEVQDTDHVTESTVEANL